MGLEESWTLTVEAQELTKVVHTFAPHASVTHTSLGEVPAVTVLEGCTILLTNTGQVPLLHVTVYILLAPAVSVKAKGTGSVKAISGVWAVQVLLLLSTTVAV